MQMCMQGLNHAPHFEGVAGSHPPARLPLGQGSGEAGVSVLELCIECPQLEVLLSELSHLQPRPAPISPDIVRWLTGLLSLAHG